MLGFPGDSEGKEYACSAGYPASIPGPGRPPGDGHGHPPQYSCLENATDRGAWPAIVYRVAKSQTRLSHTQTHTHQWIQGELDCLQCLSIDFAEQKSFVNFWGWVYCLAVCWGWEALNTRKNEKKYIPGLNSCLRLTFLYSKLWFFCFTTGILRKL